MRGGLTPVQRSSWCILQLQPTGPAIFVELQQWYYLTQNWVYKEVYTFPRGICLKVNIIERLEFELPYLSIFIFLFYLINVKVTLETICQKCWTLGWTCEREKTFHVSSHAENYFIQHTDVYISLFSCSHTHTYTGWNILFILKTDDFIFTQPKFKKVVNLCREKKR